MTLGTNRSPGSRTRTSVRVGLTYRSIRAEPRLARSGFADPELFGGVAFDPLAVLPDLAFGPLPLPSEVFDGDLGCGVDDVEGDPRTVAGHRASQEHVGERLRHLLAESPDHLGPDQRRLDAHIGGEGREEVGI